MEDFTDSNVVFNILKYASLIMRKSVAYSKAKGKWIYTQPALLIPVMERMLEFYYDETNQFINTLALDVIYFQTPV